MSILNEIAARTKERIDEEKFKVPLREMISKQNCDAAKAAPGKNQLSGCFKKAWNVLYL